MKQTIIEVINSFYDLRLFMKYSFSENKLNSRAQYTAFLTKQYHIIEKGLALPNPRLGFGEQKIKTLISKTNVYISKFGEDALTENIKSVLIEYLNFNRKNKLENPFFEEIDKFISHGSNNNSAGTKKVETSNDQKSFESFFKSRSSHRIFQNKEVADEDILKAIDIAKYTPSVCNRQGWKAHIYKGEQLEKMIKLQNGNTGFAEQIKTLAIITGDLCYFSEKERNQVNIDAGMFSMSFILALHSMQIASCALNACVSCRHESLIKKTGDIPENEKITMFIALGYPLADTKVAISSRRNTETFLNLH